MPRTPFAVLPGQPLVDEQAYSEQYVRAAEVTLSGAPHLAQKINYADVEANLWLLHLTWETLPPWAVVSACWDRVALEIRP
jgi:hypothetical protein